ncbi:MAG TPA: Hsp20/alpha crystallin family protein [Catenuloplanes sp.]|jgi:HSP20 family protein
MTHPQDDNAINVEQTDSGWTVTAALPGVAPEEVAIDIDNGELCIRGRTEAEVNQEQGLDGGAAERAFEHRVPLPGEVDTDQVDATMDHGLLTVRLPRSARRARRTITLGQRGVPAAPDGAPTAPAPVQGDPAADRELHHHPHGQSSQP